MLVIGNCLIYSMKNVRFFCSFVLAPDHIRAKKNKINYENIIKNQALTNQQRKDDSGSR